MGWFDAFTVDDNQISYSQIEVTLIIFCKVDIRNQTYYV